jgi:hypothetical protein
MFEKRRKAQAEAAMPPSGIADINVIVRDLTGQLFTSLTVEQYEAIREVLTEEQKELLLKLAQRTDSTRLLRTPER